MYNQGMSPEKSAQVKDFPRLQPLARIVDSNAFQMFISGVIILNAIVLGLETYVAEDSPTFTLLMRLNEAFYIVFLMPKLKFADFQTENYCFFRRFGLENAQFLENDYTAIAIQIFRLNNL